MVMSLFFFEMFLLWQFLSELDNIRTQCSSTWCVGSRALSFSDPYLQFTCRSVLLSFVLSFCLSATSELNISETRPDSGMVTMDGLYKLAYGLSIGHTPDDVT